MALMSLVSLCLLNSKVIARDDIDFNKAKYEEKQIVCMAKNIYYESGHESHEGKLAVAQVTMNRVNSKGFPSTVCEVVYHKTINSQDKTVCQFSWTCDKVTKIQNNYIWRESLDIARRVITDGLVHPLLAKNDALYFHSVDVHPEWNYHFIRKIGNHLFYASEKK